LVIILGHEIDLKVYNKGRVRINEGVMGQLNKIEKRLDSAVKISDVVSAFAALIARPASALSAALKVLPLMGVFFEFVCIILRQKSMSAALHVRTVDRGAQYFVAILLALSVLLIGLSFIIPALNPFVGVMYAVASSLITIGAIHHMWLLKKDPEYQALRVYVKWMGHFEPDKLKEVHELMINGQLNEKDLKVELEKKGGELPHDFQKVMAYRSSLPPGQLKEALDVQKYIEKRMDIKDSALSCGYNTAVTAVMIAALVSLSVFYPISTVLLAGVACAYIGFGISQRINHYILNSKSERIRRTYQFHSCDTQSSSQPKVVQTFGISDKSHDMKQEKNHGIKKNRK
jgi:hypothetical protein